MSKQKIRKILNYHIIIYPDEIVGNNKPCFTAYCPALEITDSGETIEQAFKNIKTLVKFHLECLKKEKVIIPEEFSAVNENFITTARVTVCL